MSKVQKHILLLVVIGLSLISITAGFEFYKSLFDLTIAILCCLIFEIIRLGCLWSFVILNWFNKVITIPIYIFVSLTCALAAITSFHSNIIERQTQELKPLENELTRRIEIIKRKYAKDVTMELKSIKDKIDLCQRKLAWNPNSSYWKNRLSQLTMHSDIVQAKCDSFLYEQPIQNKEAWISRNTSLLAIELEPLPSSMQGSTSITTAIQELWGIKEMRAKKIISIIIVITVECGILLLSLLAKGNVQNRNSNNHKILDLLRIKFEDTEIRRFLKRCQESYIKFGRPPLTRELGKKQRQIKKMIINENDDKDQIKILLENYRI